MATGAGRITRCYRSKSQPEVLWPGNCCSDVVFRCYGRGTELPVAAPVAALTCRVDDGLGTGVGTGALSRCWSGREYERLPCELT